jgi:hypothetical protein
MVPLAMKLGLSRVLASWFHSFVQLDPLLREKQQEQERKTGISCDPYIITSSSI